MRVFISYSRKDEAVAHLLGFILTSHGIQCDIDRKLPVGEPFDVKLMQNIEHAEAVLLLLSESSAKSNWVNQEIGFAAAHKKKIVPVAIESNVQPGGMIAATQSYSLFDWSDTAHTIRRLITTLRQSVSSDVNSYQVVGLDQVIHGKMQRTQFLVEQFRTLRTEQGVRPKIFHQAAFSIFAVGENTTSNNSAYEKKLLEEKRELELLIDSGAEVYLLVWPVRVRRVKERFDNLLEWMERRQNHDHVRYVCAEYAGPNQYIARGRFCAEGFKLHDKPGYEMTVVKYQPDVVNDAEREFMKFFDRHGTDKQQHIEQVRTIYSQIGLQPEQRH